jgi:hypothetical protein
MRSRSSTRLASPVSKISTLLMLRYFFLAMPAICYRFATIFSAGGCAPT